MSTVWKQKIFVYFLCKMYNEFVTQYGIMGAKCECFKEVVLLEELDKQVGERLRKAREQKGWTMREVAERIGIDHSYISKIENGRIPSLDKLKKLCTLYDIDMASLFGEKVDIPDELKELGFDWIAFAKEYEKKGISPQDIQQILNAFKIMDKL